MSAPCPGSHSGLDRIDRACAWWLAPFHTAPSNRSHKGQSDSPKIHVNHTSRTNQRETSARFGEDILREYGHADGVKIPRGAWAIIKDVARHVLKRPVVGIAAAAHTIEGRWLLIRRTDTGNWALPGGTLEWGETLRSAICRELLEEAGVDVLELGDVAGVYSDPARDARFHAVTIVVHATVSEPRRAPTNPLEISEVALFEAGALPVELSHGMTQMLDDALTGRRFWE